MGMPLELGSNLAKFFAQRAKNAMPPDQWLRTVLRNPPEPSTPQLPLFKLPSPPLDPARALPNVPGVSAREMREADIVGALQRMQQAGVKKVSGDELRAQAEAMLPEGEVMEFRGSGIDEDEIRRRAEALARDSAEQWARDTVDVDYELIEEDGVPTAIRFSELNDGEFTGNEWDVEITPRMLERYGGDIDRLVSAQQERALDSVTRDYVDTYLYDGGMEQQIFDDLYREAEDQMVTGYDGSSHHAQYFPHAQDYTELALSLTRPRQHPLKDPTERGDTFHYADQTEVPGSQGHVLLDRAPRGGMPGYAHLLEIQPGDPIKEFAESGEKSRRVFDLDSVYPALIKSILSYADSQGGRLSGLHLPSPEQVARRWYSGFRVSRPGTLSLQHFLDRGAEGAPVPRYRLLGDGETVGEYGDLDAVRKAIGQQNMDALVSSEMLGIDRRTKPPHARDVHGGDDAMQSKYFDPVGQQEIETVSPVDLPMGSEEGATLYRIYSQLPGMFEKTLGKYGAKVIPGEKGAWLGPREFFPERQPRVELPDSVWEALRSGDIPLFREGGGV